MVWGTISYNSQSHLVFLQGKVNSACYIAHRLLTKCYYHFFDRKVMCSFSRTMYAYIQLLRHNVLFLVYNNCSGQQGPQISRQSNTYVT